jgi:hypothetical protein
MRYASLALGLASVAFVGCGGVDHVGGITVRDSAGIRIVESADPVWTIPWRVAAEPTVSIGVQEGDEAYEFMSIVGAQRLGDGRIVVADGTQELRFFDEEGRFLHAVGGPGEGPGEFQSISHFTRIAHDTLFAFEMYQLKTSILDANGRFVRSFRIEQPTGSFRVMPVGRFTSGDFLMAPGTFALGRLDGPARVEREQQSTYRYGPNGGEPVVLGPFPGREVSISKRLRGEGFTESPREFGTYTKFIASGDRFVVADNATYEMQIYNPEGVLAAIFRRHHDPVPVTDQDLAALRAPRLANRDDELRRELERYHRDLPAPPETMPSFGWYLQYDHAGNLWVIEYERPSESHQRRWSVFHPDGRWLTTLRLPDGFDLMDAGDDWVLGRVRDEFDVEYVRLYDLIKEE